MSAYLEQATTPSALQMPGSYWDARNAGRVGPAFAPGQGNSGRPRPGQERDCVVM
jgi:hypothetical protein